MPTRSDTHDFAAQGFSRLAGSCIALLIGALAIATMVRSWPDMIRFLEPTCASCTVAAFRPYGAPLTGVPAGRDNGRSATGQVSMPEVSSRAESAWANTALLWFPASETTASHRWSGFDAGRNQASRIPGIVPRVHGGRISEQGALAINLSAGSAEGGETSPGSGIADRNSTRARWWADTVASDAESARLAVSAGPEPVSLNDAAATWIPRATPNWRIAAQRDLERHFPQIDTRGQRDTVPEAAIAFKGSAMRAGVFTGFSDATSGPGVRFIVNTGGMIRSGIEDREPPGLPLIHASWSGGASVSLLGTTGFSTLETLRPTGSGGFAAGIAPPIKYGHPLEWADANRFAWQGVSQGIKPGIRPGVAAEIAYSPRGEPDSLIEFLSLRFAAKYVAQKEFNGAVRGAGGTNILYLSVLGALRF